VFVDTFTITRFVLSNGLEKRLYCRLIKSRQTPFATFRLYEDNQGHRWLEIVDGDQSCLEELIGETFEQRVATELLSLGLNKYSG